MESSKIFGAEECQSSESGWTMYIGSPTSDDDDDDGHDNDHKKTVVYHDDEYVYDGSDDSMASDASSGPSHLHQHIWEGHGENGRAMDVHEHHKEDRVKKQVKKKKKKTRFEASKETKEECLVTLKRGIVTVQSGNKPRHIGQRNSK